MLPRLCSVYDLLAKAVVGSCRGLSLKACQAGVSCPFITVFSVFLTLSFVLCYTQVINSICFRLFASGTLMILVTAAALFVRVRIRETTA